MCLYQGRNPHMRDAAAEGVTAAPEVAACERAYALVRCGRGDFPCPQRTERAYAPVRAGDFQAHSAWPRTEFALGDGRIGHGA